MFQHHSTSRADDTVNVETRESTVEIVSAQSQSSVKDSQSFTLSRLSCSLSTLSCEGSACVCVLAVVWLFDLFIALAAEVAPCVIVVGPLIIKL